MRKKPYIPPITGLRREPRDTDASVMIGGATAVVFSQPALSSVNAPETIVDGNAGQSAKNSKKPRKRSPDRRIRVAIGNMEQLKSLESEFGVPKSAIVNLALTLLAKRILQ